MFRRHGVTLVIVGACALTFVVAAGSLAQTADTMELVISGGPHAGTRDSPGPLTFNRNGATATVSFEGQTKSGVKLRVTAACGSIEEL